MTKLRVLLVAAAVLTATESASAAYVPRLFADHVPNGVEVAFRQTTADDATASLAVYAPSQYASTHGASSPGTTIGRVSARVEVRAVGVVIDLNGTIVADNPLNHVSNSCSPGLHQAVWIASLGVQGSPQTIRISVYVDSTAGAPDAALGAVRLQACFPSPDVPESQGGAPLGTKLLEATFTLERVFAPQGAGAFQWLGRFVPYVAGTSTPNVAGTVETRALIRTPGRVSLRGRRASRAGRSVAVLAGVVSEAGSGVDRAVVRIRGGGRSRATTTRAGGGFQLTMPLGKTTAFEASVTVPARDVTATVCPPCVSASAAGFQASSKPMRVTLPRAKRKR